MFELENKHICYNKVFIFQGWKIRNEVNGGCEIPGLMLFCILRSWVQIRLRNETKLFGTFFPIFFYKISSYK